MKIYRDPDTGRFVSKETFEQIQREKEREEEAEDYDDFSDFDDVGNPEGEEYGEDAT